MDKAYFALLVMGFWSVMLLIIGFRNGYQAGYETAYEELKEQQNEC